MMKKRSILYTILPRIKFIFAIVIISYACKGNEAINRPNILVDFIENGSQSILPDYSYAGYAYGERSIPTVKGPIFNVTDFGAYPNDDIDDTEGINKAVTFAGKQGGGVVFFPKGTFVVTSDTSKADIVHINYSNIVMRGSGRGTDGTIIYSKTSTHQDENNSPWLSPFVFHTGLQLHSTNHFYSVEEEPVLGHLIADMKKGSRTLYLDNVGDITKGDIIIVAMRNTSDEGGLMNELIGELEYDPFQKTYIEAGLNRSASFQWAVEVEEVSTNGFVKICQPAIRDILIKFNAFVAKSEMLHEIGIEDFRFECDYQGGYKHHLNREHDYGWGAIAMHRVSHGWVKNIHINNYVQTTHLINSRNVTMSNVILTGFDGHYGPKMYHSNNNLVYDYDVRAKFTHGPGLEGASFGNVYKDIKLSFPSPIDLHGIADVGFCPPMYNLYENITNLTAFAGGGAPQNIPHAGEYNTVWGLEMKGIDHDGYNELFHSWIWRDSLRFNNEIHDDCHKQYMRSIVVGVYNKEEELTIERSSSDRNDQFIYVEGLNKNMNLPSLYQTQLNIRLNR